jgi:hypothetical protein
MIKGYLFHKFIPEEGQFGLIWIKFVLTKEYNEKTHFLPVTGHGAAVPDGSKSIFCLPAIGKQGVILYKDGGEDL